MSQRAIALFLALALRLRRNHARSGCERSFKRACLAKERSGVYPAMGGKESTKIYWVA
jgi:hypothetical protein